MPVISGSRRRAIGGPVGYTWGMTDSPFSAREFRAAAEAHHELAPEYRDAVVESFVDRIGKLIDARVDARLAQTGAQSAAPLSVPQPRSQQPAAQPKQFSVMGLALGSIALGIPLTAIAVSSGSHPTGIWGLLVVWIAIAAINIGYALRLRPPTDRR